MAITYNNLYMDLRQRLRQLGVENASVEAREIVCCGSGKSREELLRDSRLYVPPVVEQEIDHLVQRRLQGEPVAYLIGEWEFYGMPLDISEAVLIPRQDTELLVEQALPLIQGKGTCRVLDLCAGSGCIGLAVAKHAPESRVLLAEISDAALRICRQNIRRNMLSGQVTCLQVDALEKPARIIGDFDFILCNPPYIPRADFSQLDVSVRDYEPKQALLGLDEDGLGFYRSIAKQWSACLNPEGWLFFEVGIGQADAVLRIMRSCGFGELDIVTDTGGIPRVVKGKKCTDIWAEEIAH